MSASSDIEEHDAKKLARKRADAVLRVLEDLHFTAAEIQLPKEVETVKAGSFGPGPHNDVKRAGIELLPGCPHECSCGSE